jgi:hypothetical protein
MALTDNLVAYYKLDETSGSTAVDVIAANNGTITGATVNQAGKIGTAYSFDGGDHVVATSAVVLRLTHCVYRCSFLAHGCNTTT